METTSRPASDAALDRLSTTLFVLIWGFPEPSQTFIQRELRELARRGVTIHVLAGHRIPGAADPALEAIADRALYLGPARRWLAKGLGYAVQHPQKFSAALRWALGLPHRTPWHRLRMAGMLLAAASVASDVERRGFRYVHAHFAAYHTELAMALARLTGLPYGFTAHATGIWKDRNILQEKVAGARLVMTCTRHNVDHLRRLAPLHAGHVHLVYHGLDLDALPAPSPLPEEGPARFLAIGRLVPKKGFSYLLDACALLRERGVDFRLTILGDGPERAALEAQRQRLGLERHVELPGSVPNAAIWPHLARSRALVAPSVRAQDGNLDGIPNVVLEAMAMARPVVGTKISGIPEVVRPFETGLLVEPADPAALAEALATLAADPEAAAALGRGARDLVLAQFDVRADVERQLALFGAALPEIDAEVEADAR